MKLEERLLKRSEDKCELCGSGQILKKYEVPPQVDANEDNCIITCDKCLCQIEKKEELDSHHWNCLTTSIWSEVESWAADSLDMLYFDEDRL